MIITLANGSRQAMALQYPFTTATECQSSVRYWETGRTAEGYRKRGARVQVHCGPPNKPLVIAR